MQSGHKKKLALNSISSIVFQIASVVCGFILPRVILQSYGSEVNGLVNSITHFLGIISFLELGVGAVIQSTLYKPLALKDSVETSKIIASGNKFFKKLALILLVYVVGLIILYPFFIDGKFDFLYTATLIVAMSISSFAQYYFGIVDRLLLTADQRGYIQLNAQTLSLIINTIACVIVIKLGGSIQITKLTTSAIFLLRPLVIRWYVNKHYNINRKIKYEGEPIKQKWNGVAQHVAAVVLDGTDTVVLTVLSTLSNVSIYTVYHLVVNGVRSLFQALISGVQALFGELWAKQELDQLRLVFAWTEWLIHTGVSFVFGSTAVLIVPFVKVYTQGITDANYDVPIFAVLITIAYAILCLRLPYITMILAGGHYKQTQKNYIIAAALNIVISVVTVRFWGLVGVAIGTLIAMGYQTIWMAGYDSRNFLQIPVSGFYRHLLVDSISGLSIYFLCQLLPSFFSIVNCDYLSWIVLAIKVAIAAGFVIFIVNILFYREFIKRLLHRVQRIIKKR